MTDPKVLEPVPSRHTASFVSRRAEAGFTLVEMLVMLTILALLAALVAPRVIGYIGTSKTKTAKIQIESLSSALQMYRIDNGRFPTTSEGLRALVERPPSATAWNGPYLNKHELPRDPWGRDFLYQSPGQHGEFDIYSFGADFQQGGTGENADVTSWQ